MWFAAILCFIAWYPLTYNVVGGIYNLALSLFLVAVTFVSAIFNFAQVTTSSPAEARCHGHKHHHLGYLDLHPGHLLTDWSRMR